MVIIQSNPEETQHWITIPIKVMDLLGWKKGDKIVFGMNKSMEVVLWKRES
jgi:bifunctional DNA-binding transcriptional regulator/antitoxin component of YhaV-PrlF toxin-antitoxin module